MCVSFKPFYYLYQKVLMFTGILFPFLPEHTTCPSSRACNYTIRIFWHISYFLIWLPNEIEIELIYAIWALALNFPPQTLMVFLFTHSCNRKEGLQGLSIWKSHMTKKPGSLRHHLEEKCSRETPGQEHSHYTLDLYKHVFI